MDNPENILKSILPLIIIIVVSWLISSLGSRLKKQNGTIQGEDQLAEKNIFDFLSETKEEAALPENDTRKADVGTAAGKSWPGYPTGGPPVTANPIKPKWWGA